jgi:hypothetical protein
MRWSLEPHPFARDGTFTICIISLVGLTQAALLVLRPVSGNATAVKALQVALSFFVGDHTNIVAAIMTACAALAIAATLLRIGRARLALFAPQQFLLFAMAAGGLWAAWSGAYLDGTVIDWSHILSDQLVTAGFFAIHWNQTVRRARDPNG